MKREALVERTCLNCGRIFYLKESKFKAEINRRKKNKKRKDTPCLACSFCSQECSRLYRARDAHEVHVCELCGKEFKFLIAANKNGKNPGKFCSKKCTSVTQKKPESWEEKICLKCGKRFKIRKIYRQKYCSMKCYGRHKHGIKKKCIICRKPFTTIQSQEKEAKCCSVECQNEWQRQYRKTATIIKRNCLFCKREFEKSESEIKRGAGKFCSKQCFGNYYSGPRHHYWGKKFTNDEMKRFLKASQKRPTKPEKILDEITSPEIQYVGNGAWWRTLPNGKHKNPDFKVRGQDKVIEVFGDYWHRNDNPNDLINLYHTAGIDCLVIWENEIKNQPQIVLGKINSFICNQG